MATSIPCVMIESPYSGDIEENTRYAILAMRDSLRKGEAPYLSHLLYTQHPERGYVPDNDAEDELSCVGRDAAIDAGQAWASKADYVVVYTDRGISTGMKYGIARAEKEGQVVKYRTLEGYTPINK